MKVSKSVSLLAGLLAVIFVSCEKKTENFEKVSEGKLQQVTDRVYPLDGNELSNPILPKRKLPRAILTRGALDRNLKVKIIDSVCEEYTSQTTKLNISGLEAGKYVTRVEDRQFRISTDNEEYKDGFVKLTSGPSGWWPHWNYSPYTESEYPEVLFVQSEAGNGLYVFHMYFNKPLKMFGFEIAPNTPGPDHEVTAFYQEGDYYRSETLFSLKQTVSTPSGARLLAVKSEGEFWMVTVSMNYPPSATAGFAITNIRYALAD